MAKSNVSNEQGTLEESPSFKRIPMTSPTRKLEVPEMPGFKMYWFRGEPGRLQRALRAGYEFVKPEEVDVFSHDLAGNLDLPGHADMGDRVSVAAQDGADDNGQFLRLYLMKIKLEWWTKDQEQYEAEKIDPIVKSLNAGNIGVGEAPGEMPGDADQRYQKKHSIPEMFKRKPDSKIVRT
jgi:hypothetical protein